MNRYPEMASRPSPSARKALVCTLLVGALVLSLVGTAHAHLRAHEDANDTTAPLDMKRVSLHREGGQLTAAVRTYDRLRKRHFITGDAFFFKFDSRGDGRTDFTLRMDFYEGYYPYCTLYDRNGFSRAGRQAEKTRRSFTCSLPAGEVHATRHIRWRAVSDSSGGPRDRAPNGGGMYDH